MLNYLGEIKHAGAVIVTDARLLLFPVRSLTSQFKWVTCPAAILRYKADYQRLGGKLEDFTVPQPEDNRETFVAITPRDSQETELFLEEYRFSVESNTSVDIKLIDFLAGLMETEDSKALLKKQLVIVSDDSFAHIVNHATPVNAHISIDSQTKTVLETGLWYEETLPPETLLYFGLSAHDARSTRKDKARMEAYQVLANVLELFDTQSTGRPWLQLGGNETVGMGWCAVKIQCLGD